MENGTVRRLPLWRNCFDKMEAEGLEHGKVYPAEFFEKELEQPRDTLKFGIALSEIRKRLEERGFYLSGRGQKGNQFVVIPASSNVDVMSGYASDAMEHLRRALVLGANTRRELLNETERRKLERAQERIAIRAALMHRPGAIHRHLAKTAPKLLNGASKES